MDVIMVIAILLVPCAIVWNLVRSRKKRAGKTRTGSPVEGPVHGGRMPAPPVNPAPAGWPAPATPVAEPSEPRGYVCLYSFTPQPVAWRCPVCDAENESGAAHCQVCGEARMGKFRGF